MTGRRAFLGNSTTETLAAVLREQPKGPSEVTPDLPRDLERVILRCLQKDADRRFQHMADVKVELQEIKEESDSQPVAAQAPARRHRRWWLAAALAGALLLVVAVWPWWRPREIELGPPRLVPLTSMSGFERSPTFSPDGDQVAFTWDGEKGHNQDIYLKMIGFSQIRRLTTDPAEDAAPSWSPDGRQIAFVRRRLEGATIHLVSPLGGSDRKVSDFPAAAWGQLSWSSDGRFLAAEREASGDATTDAGGIYLVPLAGGEGRRIAQVKAPGRAKAPAFSPDGRRLAYAVCYSQFDPTPCDVQLVELGDDALPKGPPRRVTPRAVLTIGSLTWTRDGSAVVFDSEQAAFLRYLWRVDVKGDRAPDRIELAGPGGTPATARSRNRLAFYTGPI